MSRKWTFLHLTYNFTQSEGFFLLKQVYLPHHEMHFVQTQQKDGKTHRESLVGFVEINPQFIESGSTCCPPAMSSRPQSHSPDYRHLKQPSLYILCRQTGLGWSLPGPGLVPHWDKPRFLRWLPSPVNRGSMLAPWLTELTSQQQLTTAIEKSIIGSS